MRGAYLVRSSQGAPEADITPELGNWKPPHGRAANQNAANFSYALEMRLAPIKDLKFTDPRYEMIDPKVQRYGDVAVLTFNLVNYGKPGTGEESVVARWNSTEVYSRIAGKWRIIHSHWSYIKPQVKGP